ncbi:MAG: MotA/TolQ/ExbB proton channel family protein [Pirellula sp.]
MPPRSRSLLRSACDPMRSDNTDAISNRSTLFMALHALGRLLFIAGILAFAVGFCGESFGQTNESSGSSPTTISAEVPVDKKQMGIDFIDLLIRGGVFMIPIGVTSLVVVTFVFDRWIGLRSGRLLPNAFRKSMTNALRSGKVDPRELYRLCNESRCAASEIAKSGIVLAGRPQSEIATAVNEATQRQVDRAYANVRWLNLGAGIAPLLGLLGTVWGLIRAFHDTTQLTAGQNRADFLAVGIYEALVTTLAGLIVAIPAAIASHYFEGKITKAFGRIEELMSELVRSLEPFESKTRFDIIGRELAARDVRKSPVPPPNAPPVSRRTESPS